MPNKDGTGPLGQGPIARFGQNRNIGKGIRIGNNGQGQGGSKDCTCPKCGCKESHTRGIPCSEKKCPKCETPMKGIFCS